VLLKLKVLSYKGLPLSSELTAEFDLHGGTIGRKLGNTLVLTDAENFVSGHHAEISCENGQYYVKDTSKNGTYLVNAGINLNNAQAAVQSNEILRIGEYEVLVEAMTDAQAQADVLKIENLFSSPFSSPLNDVGASVLASPLNIVAPSDLPVSPFTDQPPSSPFNDSFSLPAAMPAEEGSKDIAEFLKGLDSLPSISNSVETPFNSDSPNPDLMNLDANASFANQQRQDVLSDDVYKLEPASAKPPPQSAGVVKESQSRIEDTNIAAASAELMLSFLEGAGIKDHAFLPPEQRAVAMKSAGALFRSLIEGLMDVLRARAEMKSEFRVSVTTIRSFDNNPLKFNPDVESVLKLMLAPNNPAFIHPNDAVNEAFKDIKYHQVAMTAAIQASLAEILHRFNPECFEKTLGEGILFQKKARCWELYCKKYPELKSLALEDFFGEEFADAYEKQMRLFSRR